MKKKKVKHAVLFFALAAISICVNAQTPVQLRDSLPFVIDSVLGIVDPSVVNRCHYIRFAKNRIDMPADRNKMIRFFEKFDSADKFQDRQLVIYHFGGSHVQADIYSNRMRNYLQSYDSCMKGPRGWIFPFAAVHTNTPPNYKVEYSGKWTSVRSPIKRDSSKILGIIGISATSKDSVCSLKIYASEEASSFQFTRLRVYYNVDSSNHEVQIKEMSQVESVFNDDANGFTEFDLTVPLDTVNLTFKRRSGDSIHSLTLYGILLLNNEPGIIYNSIGVNGAGFDSYQRSQLFEEQLAQLPPDLVIISIGTNDANDADFSPKKFANNYIRFVESILSVNPNCAFIFTVPNDNYYKYRYPQKNIAKCKAVIYAMAEKFHAGVWDFYDIMGGYGSSQKWYRAHLMKRDRIHFTNEGYKIKGDLFYEAFLKWHAEFSYFYEHQIPR